MALRFKLWHTHTKSKHGLYMVVLRAVRGRDARLPCGQGKVFLDGPDAYVLWLKNDREFLYRFPNEDSEKGAVTFDRIFGTSCSGGSCHDETSLLIKRVGERDEGVYRCRVHYQASPSLDYVIELRLVESPGSPKIYNENCDEISRGYVGPLSLGSNLTLICEVDDNQPDTLVYWRRNGVLIERAHTAQPGLLRAEVHVQNTTRSELDAHYECLAQNADVTDPLSASLVELHDGNYTVSSLTLAPSLRNSKHELICRAHNSHLPNGVFEDRVMLTVGYRPMCLTTKEETIGAMPQEAETVSCIVEASPEPFQFSWTFANSRTLYTSVKKVLGEDNRYSSTLTWLPRNGDLGILHCRATNSFGEQKRPCSFAISSGGPPSPPECMVLRSFGTSWRVQCKKAWSGGRPQTIHLELMDANGALLNNMSDPAGDFNLSYIDEDLNMTAVVYASSVRGRSESKIMHLQTMKPLTASVSDRGSSNSTALWVEAAGGMLAVIAVVVVTVVCFKASKSGGAAEHNPDLVPRSDGSFHREPDFEREERLLGTTNITVNQLATCQNQYTTSPVPSCRVVVGCGPHQAQSSCPATQHSYYCTNKLRMSDYATIKEQCLQKRVLWEDPDFPPVMSSIFYHQVPPFRFEWKRPKELHRDPIFMSKSGNFGVVPGCLGDNWLVTCLGVLFTFKGLFFRAVPKEQALGNEDEYAGIFRFNLWYNGQWSEVLIDDRLPTLNGRLTFLHSNNPREFWPSLFEKAYAKVLGSYEAIKYGNICDGLADMTGGLAEQSVIDEEAPEFLEALLLPKTIIIAKCHPPSEFNLALTGLERGVHYRICEMKDVHTSRGLIRLVKLKKPAPNAISRIVINLRDWMYITNNLDTVNCAWILYTDFCTIFPAIDYLHLDEKSSGYEDWPESKLPWLEKSYQGSWKRGVSAGGCKNELITGYFHTNPQILINIEEEKNIIIVCLYQHQVTDPYAIGYSIYHANDLDTNIATKEFFSSRRSFYNSEFSNARRLICRLCLRAGSYLIVPSTFEPNCELNFTLRVFSVYPISMKVLDEPLTMVEDFIKPAPIGSESNNFTYYEGVFLHLADECKSVNVFGLQECLETCLPNDHIKSCCALDTCRQIILSMDKKGNGSIAINEFRDFLFNLREWQTVFNGNSKERMGVLKADRLRETLKDLGFTVPSHILSIIALRFMKKDGLYRFGDFVSVILYLYRICVVYYTNKPHMTAEELDTWLSNALKC
ncbi:hypothetical protein K1T71_000446 [Dendrolimus kikuchii]|uniref:Uncharacterized protein n=1 Tax=Dendrolimus kikuchii TaxID=765133 RepID=A0ACC1DJ75_9NEOP|nr:hypothetical protein K1T71_000446 [Dendrolimus kikuchii]